MILSLRGLQSKNLKPLFFFEINTFLRSLQLKFPNLSMLLIFKNHLTLIPLSVIICLPCVKLPETLFIVRYEKIKNRGSDIISLTSQRNFPSNLVKLFSTKKGL